MKTKASENLEKLFNLPASTSPFPMEEIEELEEIVPEVVESNHSEINYDIDEDYTKARNNLHKLIERGDDAMEVLLAVAKESQSPRAFEVVVQLIREMGGISKDLLHVQEKKKKILHNPGDKKTKSPTNITNNKAIVFAGTTADFQQLIKKELKDENI